MSLGLQDETKNVLIRVVNWKGLRTHDLEICVHISCYQGQEVREGGHDEALSLSLISVTMCVWNTSEAWPSTNPTDKEPNVCFWYEGCFQISLSKDCKVECRVNSLWKIGQMLCTFGSCITCIFQMSRNVYTNVSTLAVQRLSKQADMVLRLKCAIIQKTC